MTDTAVDLFHDALTRRQVYLQRFSGSLSNKIKDLLDATEQDVRAQIERRLARMVERGVDFGPDTTSRLKVLEASIGELRASAWDDATDLWTEELRGVAVAERDFLDQTLKEVLPAIVETSLPGLRQLSTILTSRPFQGKVMKDWAGRLRDEDLDRIMNSLRVGLVQGDSIDDLSRRVLGSSDFDGADGVMSIARDQVDTVTRTATNFVMNETRGDYFEANDDIVPEEVYTATLDSATTAICRALDGQRFPVGEGPQPPQHWNCRSIRVAVFNAKLVGQRPAKGYLEKDLEGMTKGERQSTIRDLTGTVPAKTTYQQFLARQTVAFQDEVLGETKGQLFRDGGLKLTRFVDLNSGREFTLSDLAAQEPAAFRRAGLDPRDFR